MTRSKDSAVRSSFERRYRDYIDRLAWSAPENLLADALAAADESAGLAQLISANVRPEPAADPLAPARARARAAKQEVLRRAGGVIGVQEVADRLGISRQAVDQRRRRGTLLAIQEPHGGFAYPAFQFEPPEFVTLLAEILPRFRIDGDWVRLAFLLAPARALNGKTPVEALRAGDLESVAKVVAAYGDQGGV